MKYRLALKLDNANKPLDGRPASGGAIGWAVIRLGQPKTAGVDQLPYDDLGGPGEARVVVYDRPDDMFEPMPLADYEQRIKVVIGTLPDDCVVTRVPFCRVEFLKWLEKNTQPDSHQARANWANTLRL